MKTKKKTEKHSPVLRGAKSPQQASFSYFSSRFLLSFLVFSRIIGMILSCRWNYSHISHTWVCSKYVLLIGQLSANQSNNTLNTFLTCFECVLSTFWTCFWKCFEPFWKCFEYFLNMFWTHHEHFFERVFKNALNMVLNIFWICLNMFWIWF